MALLAVQRDAAPSRHGARRLGGMAAENSLQCNRVESLQDVVDGGVRGCTSPACITCKTLRTTPATLNAFELYLIINLATTT